MTNEEQKLREIVERWMGKKHPITMQSYVSDLTALIEEHYVSKEAYNVIKEHYQSALAANDVEKDYIDKYYYPKEFVEWYIMGKHGFGRIDDKLLLMNVYEGSAKKYTIDDMFNWWKENER
jgi:hypothetical protein